jgi:hypothetical protein
MREYLVRAYAAFLASHHEAELPLQNVEQLVLRMVNVERR